MASEFANNLRQFRQAADLRQSEVAAKMNVTQNAISSWETGRTEPNLGQVAQLCRILDCTLEDLTGTRARRVGEITMEDILVKINGMSPEDLAVLQDAIQQRRDLIRENEKLDRERQQLEMRIFELNRQLDELKSSKESIDLQQSKLMNKMKKGKGVSGN